MKFFFGGPFYLLSTLGTETIFSMKRRAFAVAVATACLAGIGGCESDPKPSHTATLLDNDKVHEAMTAVDGALANLEGDVDDFDTGNWREVVPEVKSGTDELREAIDSLKLALGYPQA
jgi:hypothetical protein